jgi:hypothetical protein
MSDRPDESIWSESALSLERACRVTGGQDTRFLYRAFLSYSHADAAAARKLHRRLEAYRVPRDLVGTATPDGPVPRTLFPIFRDRDELSADPSLNESLLSALTASAHLVVLCSPAAAQSRWVNEEILTFKRLGRAKRVHALIVARDAAIPIEHCFPPALLAAYDEAGAPQMHEPVEPIAADLRPEADGPADALLKIISALLGVPFDQLRRRERLAARRRRRLQIAAAASVAALCAGLAFERWQAARFQEEADDQQNFGIRVINHLSTLDLSGWQPTTSDELAARVKKSSAIATDRYAVVRTQLSSPSYKHIIGTSSPIAPDVTCEGCTVTPRRPDAASRTTYEFRLSFDISHVALEDSLPISYATTYWNAFQTPDQWWCGVRISELTEDVTLTVIFPHAKEPLTQTLRFYFHDVADRPYPLKPETAIVTDPTKPDRVQRISWHVRFPLTDRSYRIAWDWSR